MNIGIMCGSLDTASLDSRLNNSEAISAILNENYTFVMGVGETGSMRDIKEKIKEEGLPLIVVGNKFQLDRATADLKIEVSSTFERLEKLYNNTDAIIFLEGGIGTLVEASAFLGNAMEMDDNKTLIFYNESGFYNQFFKILEQRKKEGLVSSDYHHYFTVANSIDDLVTILKQKEEKLDKGRSILR